MSDVLSAVLDHPQTGAKALFLFAAFVSFVLSIVLWFSSHHDEGIFVGLWVPSILSLGSMVTGGQRR